MENIERIGKWAEYQLKRGIIHFDTETTGLGRFHQIVEISLVDGITDEILFDSFVKPTCKMDPNAFKVNNITPDLYKNAPSMKDMMPVIGEIIGDRPLGAWNMRFDKDMLIWTAEAFGFTLSLDDTHCAMLGYKEYLGINYKPALKSACAQMGVIPGMHRSLGDALALSGVFRAMSERRIPNFDIPLEPSKSEILKVSV